MKAHLSPSHIQSRKRLHFFSWDCKLDLLFTILFPISCFPFFSWFKSIRLSGGGLCSYKFTYLVPQYCWLEAHESISIFATRLFLLHQTLQADVHRNEAGTVHPFPPAETLPGRDANHSKTSLLVENQHIQHDSNQTIAHQTGFQILNFLSVPLQLWGLHYWFQCCWM